jgi:cation:H+ antiporter
MVSADRFVCDVALLGRFLGCSPMFVGIVLVGFATAFPEMLVSFFSAWQGHNLMALGNAFGSFITNIGLVIGMTTLFKVVKLNKRFMHYELPIMGGVLLIALYLMHDGVLSRLDAYGLLALFCGYMIYLYWMSKHEPQAVVQDVAHAQKRLQQEHTIHRKMLFFVLPLFSFAIMLFSVNWVVVGAISVAHYFGLSELVIGLTIVAIGTSLPELAASVAAVRRNEFEIAIGNVIGSNIIGILVVLPMSSLFTDTVCSMQALMRDGLAMFVGVVLCFVTLKRFGKGHCYRGGAGYVFLVYFVLYLTILILFPF